MLHPVHHVAVDLTEGPCGARMLLTPHGPAAEYLAFVFAPLHAEKSRSWRQANARAVGAFVDFILAHVAAGLTVEIGPKFFETFKTALQQGTVEGAGADARCPLGLWWPSRSPNVVNDGLRHVLMFADFCHQSQGWPMLNPVELVNSTAQQNGAAWRSWSRARLQRQVPLPKREPATQSIAPPSFPSALFEQFLVTGFQRTKGRANSASWIDSVHLQDVMIALLCGAGGLRHAEPFHLFVDDVDEDPSHRDVALVRVRHPSEGLYRYPDAVRSGWAVSSRADYLRREGLIPRNRDPGRHHAGWKNPALLNDAGDQYMVVHWHPVEYGRIFYSLYKHYLLRRPSCSSSPFLFLSGDGGTYTIRQYEKKFAIACARVGVSPRKAAGGTSHGLRHMYGRALYHAGFTIEQIAQYMHHREHESALVYTYPSPAELADELNKVISPMLKLLPPLVQTAGLP